MIGLFDPVATLRAAGDARDMGQWDKAARLYCRYLCLKAKDVAIWAQSVLTLMDSRLFASNSINIPVR